MTEMRSRAYPHRSNQMEVRSRVNGSLTNSSISEPDASKLRGECSDNLTQVISAEQATHSSVMTSLLSTSAVLKRGFHSEALHVES